MPATGDKDQGYMSSWVSHIHHYRKSSQYGPQWPAVFQSPSRGLGTRVRKAEGLRYWTCYQPGTRQSRTGLEDE